jgi:hypothetical protein
MRRRGPNPKHEGKITAHTETPSIRIRYIMEYLYV